MGKRATVLVATLSLAFAALLSPASPAQAAPAPAPGQTVVAQDPGVLLGCWVTPAAGVDAVNVRTSPSTSASRLGVMYPGQTADAACTATAGGTYTACGGTSNWWIQVIWTGATGYVAWRCVNWYYD